MAIERPCVADGILHGHLTILPNLVTLIRPVCTVPFVLLCIRAPFPPTAGNCAAALLLFIVITGSDLLDGWLARRLGQRSALGRTLDHLCDVVFILAAMAGFVSRGLVPWWLPASIAWAFVLYAVDSWWRTAGQPRRTLLGSRLGHLGGILYYTTVGVATANFCLHNGVIPPLILRAWFLGVALLALLSGTERFMLLRRAAGRRVPGGRVAESPRRLSRSEP